MERKYATEYLAVKMVFEYWNCDLDGPCAVLWERGETCICRVMGKMLFSLVSIKSNKVIPE